MSMVTGKDRKCSIKSADGMNMVHASISKITFLFCRRWQFSVRVQLSR